MVYKRVRQIISPWSVTFLFALLYIVVALARSQWDPMAFVMVGGKFDTRVPNQGLGYDGQFAYQIARDPLNGWRYVDVPAYRYQRILYPLVARLLSFGNESVLPWVMILINLASLVTGTWIVERMLRSYGLNGWYSLGYGLFSGLWMSLRLDLTEPLSFLFLWGGLWAFERKKWVSSAGLLACALLSREVTLLFAVGCIFSLLASRRFSLGFAWGSGVVLPFLAWQVVLWRWFGEFGLRSGGAFSSPVEWIPYRGWWGFASLNPEYFWIMSLLVVPVAVIPSIAAIWAGGMGLCKKLSDVSAWILLLNGCLIAILPRSILLDPLGLIRTLIGLLSAVIFFGMQKPSRRALNYSLLWLTLSAFLLMDGFLPKYP